MRQGKNWFLRSYRHCTRSFRPGQTNYARMGFNKWNNYSLAGKMTNENLENSLNNEQPEEYSQMKGEKPLPDSDEDLGSTQVTKTSKNEPTEQNQNIEAASCESEISNAPAEVILHYTGDPTQVAYPIDEPANLDRSGLEESPEGSGPSVANKEKILSGDEPTVINPVKPITGEEPTQVVHGGGESWMAEQPTRVMRSKPIADHSTNGSTPTQISTSATEKKAAVPAVPPGARDALPRRVDELDLGATQVSNTAFHYNKPQTAQPADRQFPPTQAQPPVKPPVSKPGGKTPKKNGSNTNTRGCLVKAVIILLFIIVLGIVVAGAFLVYQYFTIAATLPSVDGLKERASQFETTRIYDRNGQLLYELLDPNAGRRTYIPLKQISPYVIAATIATEDKEFYNHPGFNPVAIARALVQNYTSGEVVSGASTITQQLARALLLEPSERTEVSVRRKAREIILAAEITRRYSKDEILELYLNEIYYGNLAYGIEAAAETYFNTTADKLDLAQSAFLAGLPQAPAVYDIFTNRDETLFRNKQVLTLMYDVSKDKGCIYVSTVEEKVCLEAQQAADAYIAIDSYNFVQRENQMVFPHWVNYIRYLLEESYDPQTIYRSGFQVYTTLDPQLQDEAERIVKAQVDSLADKHVTDGALVAIRPTTGEVLAMVGSADFYNDAIAGQINMALRPRQPGSSIKPLTYAAAFEKGWTPATLVWDVPSEFPPSGDPNDTRDPYIPENYDGKFHGPVTVRSALANSYNIPAVKALQYVGIYDDPNTTEKDGLIAFAERMGITTLTRNDYGLSLTLGGGDVTLFEMTSAFSIFANNGKRVEPMAITKITDYQGNVIFQASEPTATQVIKPEHAYLITSILSDNQARTPMFGANSVLNLPFQVAAKTGTTNDYRDNWTIGYTPNLAVGTWVGNADYTPMEHTSGITGAAPIWSEFMQAAVPYLTGNNPSAFSRPEGIVEKVICSVSGTEPSEYCPGERSEIFYKDQLPLTKDNDLWKHLRLDTWTNLAVSSACEGYSSDKFVLNVTEKWAVKWIKETDEGKIWAKNNGFDSPVVFAPQRECRADDPRPNLVFVGLEDHQTIYQNPLDLYAVVNATANFKNFYLEYAPGEKPTNWKMLVEKGGHASDQPQKLLTWNLDNVPSGIVTLRLYMEGNGGVYAEKLFRINIQAPTPTPTMTPTPTPTPTLTPTITPTVTITPTETPSLIDIIQTLIP